MQQAKSACLGPSRRQCPESDEGQGGEDRVQRSERDIAEAVAEALAAVGKAEKRAERFPQKQRE